MFIYILIAIILFVIAICDEVIDKFTRNFFYYFIGFALFVLVAFRGENMDMDYNVYLKLLRQAPALDLLKLDVFEYIKNMTSEFSFSLMASFDNFYLGGKLRYILIVYAFLGVLIKFISFKRLTEFYLLASFCYFANFFLLHEMTQIRAGIATGFILLSIPYIQEKNFSKFLCCISVAFIFHYSSVLAFPLYLLKSDKIDIKLWISLIFVCLFLYVTSYDIISLMQKINIPIFSEKLAAYVKIHRELNIFNVFILVQMFLSAIVYYYRDTLMEKNKNTIVMLKMNLISILCFYFFGSLPVFAFRLNELFGVVQIILLTNLIYCCKPRILATFFIGVCCFGILYINLFYNKLLEPYFWSF